MNERCEQCGEVGSIRTDATLQSCTVCTNCGHIVEECSVVSEKDLDGTSFLSSNVLHGGSSRIPTFHAQRHLGLRWNPSTRRGEGLRAAAKSIPALISALGLQQNFTEEAKAVLGQVISAPNVPKWKSMKLVAAGCIYVACKKQRKPIGLVEIANAANIDRYQFAKFYKKLSEHLKKPIAKEVLTERERIASTNLNAVSAVDLDNIISRVCENILKESITDFATRQKISIAAAKIARLAQQELLLGTGRNPGSVAAASIAVVGPIFGFNYREKKENHRVVHTFPSAPLPPMAINNSKYEEDEDDEEEEEKEEESNSDGCWNADYVALCEQLNVAMTTVETRKKELEDFLIKKARGLSLPWANSITRTNLPFHLQSLIRHFEFAAIAKQSPSSQLNPPAFCRQEKQRRKRAAKIEAAKERLRHEKGETTDTKKVGGSATGSLSEEDRLIEKCLREGIPEREILEGHYNSLLSEVATKKRKESGQDDDLMNDELGEKDIPEKELREFLRTPEEMLKLKSLLSSSSSSSSTLSPSLLLRY